MKQLFQKKALLTLLLVFVLGILLMFSQKFFGVPLPLRMITSPAILLVLSCLYFIVVKPVKPVMLWLSLMLLLLPLIVVITFITHGLFWKDLTDPGFKYRLAYLLGIAASATFIASLFAKVFLKKS